MVQSGRQAWVELQRPAAVGEVPVEPEDPAALEDLVVELLAAQSRTRRQVVSSVMAVFDFHGDSDELAARYDAAIHKVVAVSSARPVIHLAVPREYGFMVVDVWSSEEALQAFEQNEEFRRVLQDAGLPEPRLRVYPLHNLGWPVDAMPLYR